MDTVVNSAGLNAKPVWLTSEDTGIELMFTLWASVSQAGFHLGDWRQLGRWNLRPRVIGNGRSYSTALPREGFFSRP